MTAEDKKAIIRRWVDIWHTHNLAALADILTSDYVRHDPNTPEVHGPEAQHQLMTMFLTALPDLHFTIEDLLAEGDTVVGRFTATATHQGELFGLPPTQRPIAISAVEIYRLADNKIAEQWVVMDALGMLQQLGAIPTPGQATQEAGA